jgi:catechol 2,3-dioxygenase-like lactoylglutathione lyase family enzyme
MVNIPAVTSPPLNQVAFSVADLRTTERWFREAFGFLPAGGSRWMMRGPLAATVQGLPRAASTCWWLVGRNPWFQLEFFQFERPRARPLPGDYRPCDIGYSRIGLWVADFDATLSRLAALGSRPLTAPVGLSGARRTSVRSPDGVHVEIMEDDPLGFQGVRTGCPVAVRSVTLSVPNLRRSRMFFHGLGLDDWTGTLHTPEHEAMWGLRGARLWTHLFRAGDVILELAQYLDPPGKPRPVGYRISDQGILNMAFGARSKSGHVRLYERAIAAGARPNARPVHLPGIGGVVYVNDRDAFSVELLWLKPGKPDRAWGFEPLPIEQRPVPAPPHPLQQASHS